VTERGKKSRNLNPGLTAWVIRLLAVKSQGDLSNRDRVSLLLCADDRYYKEGTNRKAGNSITHDNGRIRL